MAFRAGDVVKRVVDGTKFVLAVDEHEGRIGTAGWPSSWEDANHFVLDQAATDEEREKMLHGVATSNSYLFRVLARSDWLKEKSVPFSKDSPHYFELGEVFESPAGSILNVFEGQMLTRAGGVSIINSRAGSIRSNHWHRQDAHVLYVLWGSMLYFTNTGSVRELLGATPPIPKPMMVSAGQAVITGSDELHATAFIEETMLLSISRFGRTHDSHEQDVVRVPWVTPEYMKELIPWVEWR